MSSHADTIRDYTTNTERYDGQWHRLPTEQEVLDALDALLAENQRLREERAQVRAIALDENASHIDRLLRIEKLTREALAGDTDG